jgi:hypothetical protein
MDLRFYIALIMITTICIIYDYFSTQPFSIQLFDDICNYIVLLSLNDLDCNFNYFSTASGLHQTSRHAAPFSNLLLESAQHTSPLIPAYRILTKTVMCQDIIRQFSSLYEK